MLWNRRRVGPASRIWRRAGLVLLGLAVSLGGLVLYAPHLPALLAEGLPATEWPAAGHFATVGGRNAESESDEPPAQTMNGWLGKLFTESHGRALLVSQDGRLLLEHYADGVSADTRFNSYSLVKSLIGALVLKGVAEGRIRSLNAPIGDFLPDVGDATLRTVPIGAFLHMRSGMRFELDPLKTVTGTRTKNMETARLNPFGPLARLHVSGVDAVAARLRVDSKAVGRFSYQNANTALLGAVLERVYRKPLHELLSEKIWRPAGARTVLWRRHGEGGPVSPYCCLYARPRDWLQVAVYLAKNGEPAAPFLPAPLWRSFYAQDLRPADLRNGHYSHHVRHDILDRSGEPLQGRFTYFSGADGQVVYTMPDKKLVVVRFGAGRQLLHSTLYAVWRALRTPQQASRP